MCFATPGGVEIRALRAKIIMVLRTKIFHVQHMAKSMLVFLSQSCT